MVKLLVSLATQLLVLAFLFWSVPRVLAFLGWRTKRSAYEDLDPTTLAPGSDAAEAARRDETLQANVFASADSQPDPRTPVPPFLLRGIARGIDMFLYLQVLEIAFQLKPFLPPGLYPLEESSRMWFDIAVSLTAIWIYPTLAEGLGGATLGKLLTGLRVTDVRLGAPSWKAVALRNLGLFVDLLIFGLIAYSAIRSSDIGQRVGDGWGHTRVVWQTDAPVRASWYGWLVGLLASVVIVAASYVLVP